MALNSAVYAYAVAQGWAKAAEEIAKAAKLTDAVRARAAPLQLTQR